MKNKTFVLTVILIGIFAVVIVLSTGWATGANRGQAAVEFTLTQAVPGEPDMSSPWTIDSGDEIPPDAWAIGAQSAAPEALPTAIPGETLVYFVTTDNDATATVLYLYNTDTVTHTVALRGYSYNGVLVYSLSINIEAGNFLRLSSDSIAAAPPPSWATPAPIITNFTDFTYFASLSLPKGVKVEGYVLFNPATGTVDPRVDQGAIPLRFSTDPATVFLPSLQKAP
jgi:hypothetical protein